MTGEEFGKIMDRLRTDYGATSYPDGLAKRIWDVAGRLPAHDLERAIGQIQDEMGGRAPNVAAILAKLRPALARDQEAHRRAKIATQTAETGGCPSCGGSGWVEALQKPDLNPIYTFAFICSRCDAAQIRGIKPGKGAIEWYPELEERYLPKYPSMRSVREVDEEVRKAGWDIEPYKLKLDREERERKARHDTDLQRAQEMEQAPLEILPTMKPQDAPPKTCPF